MSPLVTSRREGFFWVRNQCVANLEAIDGVLTGIFEKFQFEITCFDY